MPETPWQPLKPGILTGTFDENLKQFKQASHSDESEDVIVREFTGIDGQRAAVFFVDGMVSDDKLQRYIIMPVMKAEAPPEGTEIQEHLIQSVLPVSSVTPTTQLPQAVDRIFGGDVALLVDGMDGALVMDVKGYVRRAVMPPRNESVVLGPQEGFTESLRDNVVLIRRMMHSPALISESFSVGNRVPTRISLLYLNGIARAEVLEEVKKRISGCNVDYVSSLGMLEQLIEDKPYSLIPQVINTERPDRAVSFLTEGYIVLVMENSPIVMVLPAGMLELFHTPDDTSMRWQYGSFLRILRMLGTVISIFAPGLFVALITYHPQSIPLSLLTSVLETQAKVPLSLFSSMLIMLFAFNLINEAGSRVPGVMGSSLSIVSGLILGQAAVEADLISPLLIIIVALSGLGSYVVTNYAITIAVRIAQIALVLLGGLFGFPGIVIGTFFLLSNYSTLTSLNVPFVAPLTPIRPLNPDKLMRMPIWRQRLRSYMANPYHMNRTEGSMRAWDKKDNNK